MEAKNVSGSSTRSPECRKCGFWIFHYLTQTNKGKEYKELFCAASTCSQRATAGGHVKIKNRGQTQYIIPLCPIHNNPSLSTWYPIKDIPLALANQSKCTYHGKKHGIRAKFKAMKL